MNKKYIENVVIGIPIVDITHFLGKNIEDWENIEKEKTFFTEERYLPNILLELGIVKSKGEIRRNKPELMINLDYLDFKEIKWGKRKLFILVGCQTKKERDFYFNRE